MTIKKKVKSFQILKKMKLRQSFLFQGKSVAKKLIGKILSLQV